MQFEAESGDNEMEEESRRRRDFLRTVPVPRRLVGWPLPRPSLRRRPQTTSLYGPAPLARARISRKLGWAQGRLGRLLRRWVPVTGILDSWTRQAIRLLQSRYGLRVTGDLDPVTIEILTQESGPTDFAAKEPALFNEDPNPEPEGDSDAAPDQPEEELLVKAGCNVTLKREDWNAAELYAKQVILPRVPGLYVIRKHGRPLYVGRAENLHARFQDRFKVLRDFALPPAVLSGGVAITAYTFEGKVPACDIKAGPKGRVPTKSLSPVFGLLRLLEQYFIKHFGTKKPGTGVGNLAHDEGYSYAPNQSIHLTVNQKKAGDPPPGRIP